MLDATDANWAQQQHGGGGGGNVIKCQKSLVVIQSPNL